MRNSSPSSRPLSLEVPPSPGHLEPGLRVGEQARADECARFARRHVDRDMTYVPTLRDASRIGAMGNYVNEGTHLARLLFQNALVLQTIVSRDA